MRGRLREFLSGGSGDKNGPENLRFRGRLRGCWVRPETIRFVDSQRVRATSQKRYLQSLNEVAEVLLKGI